MSIPTGRSSYKPGKARMGEPTPQSDPELFSNEDITAEVKYLLALNKRYGTHHLRVAAYVSLLSILAQRAR
jgi:hypothetical protein